jgi:cell wall-associated NlpC family hydrolase
MNKAIKRNKAMRYMAVIITAALVLASFMPTAFAAEPMLRIGSRGDAVTTLQNRLLTLGYMDYSNPTGYFGEVTRAAVVRYQRLNGLSADGIVGPATNGKLYSADAVRLVLYQGARGEPVSAVQARLRDLGYLSASDVTGYYGDATRAAVAEFQRASGIYTDGVTGPVTRRALFGGSAIRKSSAPAATSAAKIADVALTQIGKPYVLGGNGPSSYDCSGLIYYSMTNAGFKVQRLSAAAYSEVSAWAKINGTSSLKKGDLVFFRSDTSSYISHMGIYTGGGQFVHASSGQARVITSSLDNVYWAKNYMFARRVA